MVLVIAVQEGLGREDVTIKEPSDREQPRIAGYICTATQLVKMTREANTVMQAM